MTELMTEVKQHKQRQQRKHGARRARGAAKVMMTAASISYDTVSPWVVSCYFTLNERSIVKRAI